MPKHPAASDTASTVPDIHAVASLGELSELIRLKLCAQDRLDPAQTPLRTAVLVRGNRPCGMVFEVCGPRRTRCHAIWAAEENRVLLYDSAGRRSGEMGLSDAPDIQEAATDKKPQLRLVTP